MLNLLLHRFNFDFKDKTILELFSGFGSFGLRIIKYEIKEVFFVDSSDNALKKIENHINRNSFFQSKIFTAKAVLPNIPSMILNKKFDLIFLDPPYNLPKNIIFKTINNSIELMQKDSILIYEGKINFDTEFQNLIQIDKKELKNGANFFFFKKT